ncbi:LMBR1 domain-containing protein 2 homolog [Amphibalanus amphitrite]|uniref:LMBR1 domain-containing protein 2 homolog n=1 Tax=Amphibalanus amphitrite TaxID=1232801 RepID=UPI001C906A97|nr:LMBR1 domain-containing protein 2 homolog [Amphibalanus amphitrite]XP_043199836.1 LMBR1 domain-containing protein 2 homolog [Amphibalanus amphitrite]XP_043199837.1 LMBR1 domain-containing protein 2 homolog [Amphibalanus amphitrite]XP_043199838.1 LMBR1 domain-containing protein 2 homolog [Amphibalanus amphitrite]
MTAGPLSVEIVATFCVAAALLYRYGDWRNHHVFVTISVLIAWYFSLIIVFVIPMDVSRTAYNKCVRDHDLPVSTTTVAPPSNDTILPDNVTITTVTTANTSVTTAVPSTAAFFGSSSDAPITVGPSPEPTPCERPWSYVSEAVMIDLWRVVYWTSQALTWLIMPMTQSYTQAGDFTVKGKLRTALVDNAIYYGSYLIIAIILLIYISTQPGVHVDGPHLKLIASSASNTWGLFLLVLLLGYSLVEVPRALWHAAQRGWSLRHGYFRVAKLSAERSEAEEALDDVLDSLQLASEAISGSHPLRPCVDTVLAKVPGGLQQRMKRRQRAGDAAPMPTQKSLVALHRQVIRALQHHHRTEAQWEMLIEEVIELEDVSENQRHRDGYFKPSLPRPPSWTSLIIGARLEWYWKCRLRGYALRCLSVVCAITSFMVVWSELTFFNKSPTLSLFAVFINAAKSNYDYLAIEVISSLTIAYLCVCTYYTIFKIRVLNFYYLAPNHQTDQHSLIFSGMLLCRLTPPLCLNFLGMIHMDSHIIKDRVDETAYTKIMGHMDVLAILSEGFNIYFPMCVLAFCLATWFSLGARLLSFLGFQQFLDQDEITTDLTDEGRELVRREHRRRQRQSGAETRPAPRTDSAPTGGGGGGWGSQAYRAAVQRAEQRMRSFLPRSESGESARLELLGSPDPPFPGRERPARDSWTEPDVESVGRVGDDGFSYSRTGRPAAPRGIFDDV